MRTPPPAGRLAGTGPRLLRPLAAAPATRRRGFSLWTERTQRGAGGKAGASGPGVHVGAGRRLEGRRLESDVGRRAQISFPPAGPRGLCGRAPTRGSRQMDMHLAPFTCLMAPPGRPRRHSSARSGAGPGSSVSSTLNSAINQTTNQESKRRRLRGRGPAGHDTAQGAGHTRAGAADPAEVLVPPRDLASGPPSRQALRGAARGRRVAG